MHDSMNIPKMNLLLIFIFFLLSVKYHFQFSPNLVGFLDFSN